ncbi:MAG: sigma-54-dependent Fis family transcriptional regulator, partial [Gemmatimonadota bacterium]
MSEDLSREILAKLRELRNKDNEKIFGAILTAVGEIGATISEGGKLSREKMDQISKKIEKADQLARQGRDQSRQANEKVSEIRRNVRNLFEEFQKFQTLYDIGKLVTSERDIEKLLRLSMDKVVEVTQAERGMIILVDEEKRTCFEVARNLRKQEIKGPEFEVSRNIIDEVLRNGEGLFVANALDHPQFREAESVKKLKLLSVLCMPIKIERKLLGVIYIDNRRMSDLFKESTLDLVRCFSEQIAIAVDNALAQKALQNRTEQLDHELRARYQFESIIGSHPRMVEVLKLIGKVADTDATVFIYGESGTGKELVARALHYNSSRSEQLFVAFNCAALPENLLESELFGHVKGAFTGAVTNKQGKFEAARDGTLFLDEIGEMSPNLQVKLLRVLQEGEFSPLGSVETRVSNARIVAATNKEPKKLVAEGQLREDLYYRLNIVPVFLPSLRERREDIPLLTDHFLNRHGDPSCKKPLKLSGQAQSAILRYDFPGNVRELENIIKRAVILASGDVIELTDLPQEIQDAGGLEDKELSFKDAKKDSVERFERNYIVRKLQEHGGNLSRAAEASGMHLK